MINLNIPVGISDFAEIRQNSYYYVDKSALIYELLKTEATKVTLITRPRRFGKTLGMSMLANFFDIRKNSRSLFQDLEISAHTELCNIWLNRYPTLFLTFKDVDGTTFDNAFGLLKFTISQFCIEHDYLEQSPRVSETYKNIFSRLKEQTASLTDIQGALLILMKMMQAHYRKPVILLLDEYDVPMAKASANGYYPQMLEVIKAIMSTALKDNTALRFSVVTGCLKIARESIFTGTNNFVSDTISSTRLNEYFGFTQSDVNKILKDAHAESQADTLKKWYNGYCFGNFDVYCPWDVMNYLRDLQINPDAKPVGYWKNTSNNSIIRSFIDYAGSSITGKLETLVNGGYILQPVEEDLTYDYLHSSEDNLWSILYLTGYLTKVRAADLPDSLSEDAWALKIPNAEIREIFESTILKWFQDNARTWNRRPLFDAVWKGDSEKITQEITGLLRRTISYHDYKEDFYHAFLAGIFTGAGYTVESNKEHGEGRSDVIICDPVNSRIAVFEAKCSKTAQSMSADCHTALQQIERRMYSRDFEDSYDSIFCYGISFYKKRCLVKKHQEPKGGHHS